MPHPTSHETPFCTPEELRADPLWQKHVVGGVAVKLAEIQVEAETEALLRNGRVHSVGKLELGSEHDPPAWLGGLGEAHTSLPGGEQSDRSIQTARSLVMQMLESEKPGAVRLSVYNGYLGRHIDAFADFAGLGPKLFEQVKPGGLQSFLNEIETHNLDLANRRAQVGSQAEPWQVAVVIGEDIDEKQLNQLNRIIESGPQYGSIVTIGAPLQFPAWLREEVPIAYDAPASSESIRSKCASMAAEAALGEKSPGLSCIVSSEMWEAKSNNGLEIPLGINVADGQSYAIHVGDETPHLLLTGRTGSGKSNIMNSLITSLTQKYGPKEVQLYLLDFKHGVEFAHFAHHQAYLPHAKLVGTRVDDDPEFGLAALKDLTQELARRGDRAQEIGASNYTELHDDPEGTWPRIVLVIDEFQELLHSNLGGEAAEELVRIARLGRSFGMHLALGTQSTSGIPALYDKHRALFKNIALRIASPHGTMLEPLNTAAEHLPRYHALVNEDSGNPEANIILKMPDASSRETGKPDVAGYQQRAYEAYLQACAQTDKAPVPPRVFDGRIVPKLEAARDYQRLGPVAFNPKVLVAEEMLSVKDRSAGFTLSREYGQNFAVIGPARRREEVNRVLHTAIQGLGKQQLSRDAKFSLVCLDTQSAAAVNQTVTSLRELGHDAEVVRPDNAPEFFSEINASLDPKSKRSHFVVVYGADASETAMRSPSHTEHATEIGEGEANVTDGKSVHADINTVVTRKDGTSIKAPATGTVELRNGQVIVKQEGKSGREYLFDIMERGPESGTHILASFSGPERLKDVISARTGISKSEVIGAWTAIGVQPNSLSALTPDAPFMGPIGGLDRRDRGLFYDKSANRPPRIVRIYAGPSGVEEED